MTSSHLNKGFSRVCALVLNVLVISSLLLGSFSSVLAQDELPPTETETPVIEPTLEPIVESTAEPTLKPTTERTVEPTLEPTEETSITELTLMQAFEAAVEAHRNNEDYAYYYELGEITESGEWGWALVQLLEKETNDYTQSNRRLLIAFKNAEEKWKVILPEEGQIYNDILYSIPESLLDIETKGEYRIFPQTDVVNESVHFTGYYLPWAAGKTATMGSNHKGMDKNKVELQVGQFDFLLAENQDIFAAKSGWVVYANDSHWITDSEYYYNNSVIIKHADGEYSAYLHLLPDSIPQEIKDRCPNGKLGTGCSVLIARGTKIGKQGSTGQSNWPHLHFEVGTEKYINCYEDISDEDDDGVSEEETACTGGITGYPVDKRTKFDTYEYSYTILEDTKTTEVISENKRTATRIDILAPTSAAPGYAGRSFLPQKMIVSIEASAGLSRGDFTINIGGFPATVVTAQDSNGSYSLEVLPPVQAWDGLFDLMVRVGDLEDTEVDAVNYSPVGNVDVDLVIDRSGSMYGAPMTSAKAAAKQFVDLMQLNDKIGVVSYSTSTTTNYPLTDITSSNVKTSAKTAIDSLNATGNTSIGAGLQLGQQQLTTLGSSTHPWAIVLLTDGLENTSPSVSSVLPFIAASKTKVYTIGLGSYVDQALLLNIASQTGGTYHYAPTPSQLAEIYNAIAGSVANRQTLLNVSSLALPGYTETRSVGIDLSATQAVFSLNWLNSGSNLGLTLTKPDGTTITPASEGSDPNIEYVEGTTYEYFRVQSSTLMPGTWNMNISGDVVAAGEVTTLAGEPYTVNVTALTNLMEHTWLDKDAYVAGEPVKLTVSLSDSLPIVGASVTASIEVPSEAAELIRSSDWTEYYGDTIPDPQVVADIEETIEEGVVYISLFDDGLHDDGEANDGVYANEFTNAVYSGTYVFTFNMSGTSNSSEEFNRQSKITTYMTGRPFNDSINYPVNITSIPYQTTQSFINASLEVGEPQNVCNPYDRGSLWYKFTAPSTGIYNIDVTGSDYSPNLSVLRRVSSTSSVPVVCGETHTDWGWEGYNQLAFNATAGETYLIGVSAHVEGGNLSIGLSKINCPYGYLCGAAIAGDGRVLQDAYSRILDSKGNQVGYGYGDYNGYIEAYLYNGGSGTFKVVTRGDNNIIVTNSVAFPGYFKPTAVGSPKISVDMLDIAGEFTALDSMALVSPNNTVIGGFGYGQGAYGGTDFYAPAGVYNLVALNSSMDLAVYQPGINLVSSTEPGRVVLDPRVLAMDTITITPDGLTDSYAYVYTPESYGLYWDVGSTAKTLTFAAPLNTRIPYIYHYGIKQEVTATRDLYWYIYTRPAYYLYIEGGNSHEFQIGGTLTANPSVSGAPYRLDEGEGRIYPNIYDSHGNYIRNMWYYGDVYSSSAGSEMINREQLLDRLIVDEDDGVTLNSSNPDLTEIIAQGWEWVYEDVLPTLYLYKPGPTLWLTQPMDYFTQVFYFNLYSTSPTGTWSVKEEVDVGPFGGLLSVTEPFEVYSLYQHPQYYDDFNAALNISSTMPYTGTIDTLGYTQANDDPIITRLNSRGYASAWFKYIAPNDGYLNVDTLGSNYDTVLNVWQGSRGSLSNRAYNDDYMSLQSAVGLAVRAGQTYYIEVTQYVYGSGNPSVESLEEQDPPKEVGIESGEVNAEQIGGSLTLNAALTPCYSLTVSADPATGGTVTRSPAPNCLTTKYVEGTEVTLTAMPKLNYDLWKWSDAEIQNPYVYEVTADATLKAEFVAVPGKPALSSPAANALVFAHKDLVLKWLATSPASTTYELMVSTNATFADHVDLFPDLINPTSTLSSAFLDDNTTYYWRVRGVSKMGQLGPWSLTRSFRTAVAQTDGLAIYDDNLDITEYNPANPGADWQLHTNRPQFRWLPVPGASGYTVQISRYSNFSSLVTSGTLSGEDNTRFTPTVNLPANTDLYWRVRANSTTRGPGDWGWSSAFRVPLTPPIPALVSPALNALTTSYQPKFDWSNVVVPLGQPALASYEFQIAADPGFNILWFGITVSPDTGEPVPSELDLDASPFTMDANAAYYWRVRANDAVGNFSPWSAGRKLRTAVALPALSTPANGILTQSNRPTFTWGEVGGASGYTIQISRNEAFTSLVTTGTLTGSTSINFTPTVNLPTPTTTYPNLYWRVRANSTTNGPGGWSDKRTFTVPPSPPIPVLVSPASGTLVTGYTPELKWQPVVPPAATPALKNYVIEISTDKAFSFYSFRDEPSVLTYQTPVLDPNQTYYWRVRAVNMNDDYSGWSAVRSFKTKILSPTIMGVYNCLVCYDPLSPKNTNRPVFKWLSVEGASGYSIQIARDGNYSLMVTTGTLSGNLNTIFTPAVNLPANTTLYWRVRANSTTNGPSVWEDGPTFTVPAAPGIPTLTSPASNTLTQDTTPLLNWSDVLGAAGYQYEIGTDPTFFSAQYISNPSVSEHEVMNLDRNTTYYWHVRAYYEIEEFDEVIYHYSGWSAMRSIRIAVAAPLLSAPLATAVPSLRPTFDWNEVDGASGYTLQIARNASFSTLVGTYTRTAAQSDYTPTANLPANTTLYWRVRANSATYGPGAWSASSVIMPNPPSTPTLVSPANGAQLTDTSPLLDWSTSIVPPGTEFDYYRMHVCIDADCSTPVYDHEVHSLANSYHDFGSTLLDPGTTYYWRVRAENTAGAYSAWSAVRSFRVIGP